MLECHLNPNDVTYEDLLCLYVTKQEEAHPGAGKLTKMPKAWALTNAVTERLTHEDGTMTEWDHPNKVLRLWSDKEKGELLEFRPLMEGERKPSGQEKQI